MKERIREFLRSENKTSSQFADEIGIQPSGVSHILSGRNKPSLDFILKMLETYKGLSTDWLLFGKGNMYIDQEDNSNYSNENVDFREEKAESAVIQDLFSDENREVISENNEFSGQNNHTGADTDVNKTFSERIIIFYPDGTYSEYKRR